MEVALDLSGRPFVVYDVDPISEWIGTFDPQLAEEFWQGFVDGARHHAARRGRSPARTPTTSSRRRSRAWPARLRDAVRVEGDGVPSTKGTL